MNIDKLMHKFGKRLEENYTWYQVKYIQGVLADVLTAQEGETHCPYCLNMSVPLTENQIAKRKIEEWWATWGVNFNTYWRSKPEEVINELKRWLDKEDK